MSKQKFHLFADVQKAKAGKNREMYGGTLLHQTNDAVHELTLMQSKSSRREAGSCGYVSCPQCRLRGVPVSIKQYALKTHLIDHRIHRALGTEETFIVEVRARQDRARQKSLQSRTTV